MRLPWHRDLPDTLAAAAHPSAAVDPRPATLGPEDGPPADDLDQQRRRNTATVAAYGRLLTSTRTAGNPPDGDLTGDPTGDVHVCGIGSIPIAVALAAVPVDDARHRLLLDPDNQAALDEEQRALAHLREITRQAGDTPRAPGDKRLTAPPH